MPADQAITKRECPSARPVLGVLVAIGVFGAGCQTHQIAPNPVFENPPPEVVARLTRVCVAALTTDVPITAWSDTRPVLTGLLEEELGALGLEVVSNAEVEAIVQEVGETVGGDVDAHFGTIVASRRREVEERVRNTLARRHGCDAVVESGVVGVEAPYWDFAARWDHVIARCGRDVFGHLPAISFEILLRDPTGSPIYYGAGGLHLLTEVDRDPDTGFYFRPIPEERYLRNETENRNAVRLALEALQHARAPSESARSRLRDSLPEVECYSDAAAQARR